MTLPGIFVYNPLDPPPSPGPVQNTSANSSSRRRRARNGHSAPAEQMTEQRANEFWPHPRAAVEAGVFSHPEQNAASQSISDNPQVILSPLPNPKEWDEWEKNKNWPFPACLAAHEVAELRKFYDQADALRSEASSSSQRPAISAAVHANADWPQPANALGFQAQNPTPAPVVAQPAPQTAAQRSQWPPADFQWPQQPHNRKPSHANGYSTEPERRPRDQAYTRRTQPQDPAPMQASTSTSNIFGRLKSALSGKRRAEPTCPTYPQPSYQESSSRRISEKKNSQLVNQGRHDQGSGRTRVQIASYLHKGSPLLISYDLRFSDRCARKAVRGGSTHLNADDLDMPACDPPLPYMRIYHQELPAWIIEVRPPSQSRFPYVTVGDVLYTIYKTLKQRVDWEIWERDRRYEYFQDSVNRAFTRRCQAVSQKRNVEINHVAHLGLLRVDYLRSRYHFAGLTHAHGAEGGEWFMMETVTPSTN